MAFNLTEFDVEYQADETGEGIWEWRKETFMRKQDALTLFHKLQQDNCIRLLSIRGRDFRGHSRIVKRQTKQPKGD